MCKICEDILVKMSHADTWDDGQQEWIAYEIKKITYNKIRKRYSEYYINKLSTYEGQTEYNGYYSTERNMAFDELIIDDDNKDVTVTCICGHRISHVYENTNKITGQKVIQGSCCIHTTFSIDEMKNKADMYTCDICDKTIKRCSISSHNKSKKHLNNVKNIGNKVIKEINNIVDVKEEVLDEMITKHKYKQCQDCNQYNIKKNNWKTVCISCFRKSKGIKQCGECNLYKKIGGYDICYTCNMKKYDKCGCGKKKLIKYKCCFICKN